MTTTPANDAAPSQFTPRRKVRLWQIYVASALVVLIAVGVYFINEHWPKGS